MKTILFISLSFCFAFVTAQVTYVSDHFDHPAGDTLTNHGWYEHSGNGANPILVSATGLNWLGYIGSSVGGSAAVTNTGQDINKPFIENIDSNAVYASFLINVPAPFGPEGAGFFFHYGFYTNNLTPDAAFSNVATGFRARTFVLEGNDPSTQFKLGLSFNTNAASGLSSDLEIGVTYLVVVKYEFIDGPDNDEVSLYVFAQGDDISEEPAMPAIGPLTGTAADAAALQTIALRQYNPDQNILVDGIFVKNTWDIETCIPATGTDVVSACNPFTWINGLTYTESNNTAVFNIVGGAQDGCDSLVTLNLTLTPLATSISLVDNTLTCSTDGASYQWIDCDENSHIDGATGQSFTPEVSGLYAVEVTLDSCTTTSACVDVEVLSIHNFTNANDVQVFPNPSAGHFTLAWGAEANITLVIRNTLGQTILEINDFLGSSIDIELNEESGLYFIEIWGEHNTSAVKRIVIR